MTFLAGDALPADTLNKMGCTLRRAAAQTLNDAVTTAVSWDTQDEDTDNLWTSGATITIPETGLWAISFTVLRAAASTGRSFVDLIGVAGTLGAHQTVAGGLRSNFAVGEQIYSNGFVLPLASGTGFQVHVNVDGAGNSTMTAALNCYRVVGGA